MYKEIKTGKKIDETKIVKCCDFCENELKEEYDIRKYVEHGLVNTVMVCFDCLPKLIEEVNASIEKEKAYRKTLPDPNLPF